LIIGLTGGIATGKSMVSSLLARHGSALVDADQIAREIVEPGRPALLAIVEAFGSEVLTKDGALDRKKLGEMVFADHEQRKKLEAILHPEIRELMKHRIEELEQRNPEQLIVADIPLLYESGLQSMFKEIIVVYVPRELQIQRLMSRDGLSVDLAEQRLLAQMPIEQKRELADWIIDNSGTSEQTENQVIAFLHRKERL